MDEQEGIGQELTPTEATPDGTPESAAGSAAESEPGGTPAPAPQAAPAPVPAPVHRCSWCSTVSPDGATHCPSCGASLAERESLDGMPIPGVTEIDPEVLRRNEAIHKVTSGPAAKIAALSPTVSFGLAVASTLSNETDRRSRPKATPAPIGVPSAEALLAAARLDRQEVGAVEAQTGPGPIPAPAAPSGPTVEPWSDAHWAVDEPAQSTPPDPGASVEPAAQTNPDDPAGEDPRS